MGISFAGTASEIGAVLATLLIEAAGKSVDGTLGWHVLSYQPPGLRKREELMGKRLCQSCWRFISCKLRGGTGRKELSVSYLLHFLDDV